MSTIEPLLTTPQESVSQLVEQAKEHGGSDTIMAIVVQVSREQRRELRRV